MQIFAVPVNACYLWHDLPMLTHSFLYSSLFWLLSACTNVLLAIGWCFSLSFPRCCCSTREIYIFFVFARAFIVSSVPRNGSICPFVIMWFSNSLALKVLWTSVFSELNCFLLSTPYFDDEVTYVGALKWRNCISIGSERSLCSFLQWYQSLCQKYVLSADPPHSSRKLWHPLWSRVAVSIYLLTWENSYKCRWCCLDVAKGNANRNSSAVLVLPLLYSEMWCWCEMQRNLLTLISDLIYQLDCAAVYSGCQPTVWKSLCFLLEVCSSAL